MKNAKENSPDCKSWNSLTGLINSKSVKEKKKKSKIHNNTDQNRDKAKNEQKLGEHDFLKLHAQMGA